MKMNLNKINAVILTALLLITTSCGGGGSDAPAPPPSSALTSANSASVGGAVITSGSLLIEPSYIGTADIDKKKAGRSFLNSLLNNAIEMIKNRDNTGRLAAGAKDATTNCTGGGTRREASQWSGSDTAPENYTGTITYTNCKEGAETWNGTVGLTYEGPSSAPTKITIVVNAAYTNTATSTNLTATNATIVYKDFVYTNNEITSGNITLTGNISGTTNGKAIKAGYDGFKMSYTYSGNTTAIQMTGRINPSCINTSITVSTQTTLTLPTATTCYTAGELRITDGTNTATMVFGSNTNVSVSFNNTHLSSYNSCTEIQGLCM